MRRLQDDVVRIMRSTGRFTTRTQPTTGVVTCTMVANYAATLYVTPSGAEFHIRSGALENQRFPNNDRLYDYVRRHGAETDWEGDNAFVLPTMHLAEVLAIIGAVRG